MTISITIDGFKNKEEAIEFMNWYEGSGEQCGITEWMECRKDEGKNVRTYLNTKSIDTKNLILHLQDE
jgi:hypothetical protein